VKLGCMKRTASPPGWLSISTAYPQFIGIPLEFEGREVAVETFSADILARNPQDDSLVLIENQLDGTDHSHLGQIMTYLAGLNAQTVVWIAADFREAHLSALKWLNDHTVDPFAFFAVKAVRIGESPIAPMFEVVSRPNQWERRLQAIAQEVRPSSSLGEFRKEFWTYYVDRFPDERARGPGDSASSRWRPIDSIGLVVMFYVAQRSVGVSIRGPRGAPSETVYNQLAPYADRLAELTGAEFGSPEGNYFFGRCKRGNTSDRGTWPELADWLHSTADAFEAALRSIFEEQN
jgi:hypothetical protein